MKTTIDLPEDLVREMKFRAVREGRKLRDVAEEVFRRGLAAPASPSKPSERRRVKLPIIPSQPGAKPFDLSGDRLLELELEAERENSVL
jgi:plasmid stability protein